MYSICSRTGQKSPLTGTAGRKAVIYSWAILKKKSSAQIHNQALISSR